MFSKERFRRTNIQIMRRLLITAILAFVCLPVLAQIHIEKKTDPPMVTIQTFEGNGFARLVMVQSDTLSCYGLLISSTNTYDSRYFLALGPGKAEAIYALLDLAKLCDDNIGTETTFTSCDGKLHETIAAGQNSTIEAYEKPKQAKGIRFVAIGYAGIVRLERDMIMEIMEFIRLKR